MWLINTMALTGNGTEGRCWAIWHHGLLEQEKLRRFKEGVLLSKKL